jgi:hypothetical protein
MCDKSPPGPPHEPWPVFPCSAFADFNRDGLMDIATLGQPIGARTATAAKMATAKTT